MAAVHLDLVRAPQQLDAALDAAPSHLSLSLGVVDGRNIWRTDLSRALETLERAAQARPQRGTGAGRKLVLDKNLTLGEFVARVKKHLGLDQVRVAPGRGAPRRYRTVGLGAGAGGALRSEATLAGCELFLTGEMRHHDVLVAQAEGCTVVLAGHTNTERGFLRVLRKRLERALPDLAVSVSRRDADPLRIM